MFADDTTLTACGKSLLEIESKINSDLANVNAWLLANKLSLNLVKTEYLLIGSRSKINNLTSEPNIVINNRPIKRVTETKSLGILIDQFLSWDSHLDELCKKGVAGIGAIKRLRPYFNRLTLLSVYYALVQPYYALVQWIQQLHLVLGPIISV